MKRLYSLFLNLLYALPSSTSVWLYQTFNNHNGKIARYLRVAAVSKLSDRNVDRSCDIAPGVIMKDIRKLSIGKDVSINERCFLSSYGGLKIGNSVSIGHDTTILSSDHVFEDGDITIKEQGISLKQTEICDDVFIGCKCVILAGIKIGRGAVVGAGSIVTKNIGEYQIVAGNPSKLIKNRRRNSDEHK
jgi:acetyltransferase-like isoleucine patch superfamily enzyme